MARDLIWFFLGFGMVVALSCTSMREFNPATGELSNKTELVPIWGIDEREEMIFKALEDHGRIKVIRVKEENPMVQWVFGAGLAIGGVLILLGIAFIWVTKGVRLVDGLCISGAGLTTFVTFYMIDRYLVWITLAAGVALVGSVLYIFLFKKDLLEKLIRSFEQQKDRTFPEAEIDVIAAQGNKQPVISKMRKRILK